MIATCGIYTMDSGNLVFTQFEVEEGEKYWCGVNGDCCFEKTAENTVQLKSLYYKHCRPYLEVFTLIQENPESYLRVLLSDYFKNRSMELLIQDARYNKLPEFEEER